MTEGLVETHLLIGKCESSLKGLLPIISRSGFFPLRLAERSHRHI